MQTYMISASDQIDAHEDAIGQDLQLVAAARAGSHAAFEELQSRYSPRLFRRIHLITGDHEDSEDALQETFLRAYLALDSFEGRSQFSSWLTRIAINSALMVLRSRRRRAEVSYELPSETGESALPLDPRDTALNPEELYVLRQKSDYALRAIRKANIKLQIALTTWIEQDCSMKEVAQTLDLSLATVKARVHRARKRLTCSTAFKESVANA